MDRRPQLPPHMRCAAHTLNLVASSDAEDALDDPMFEERYTSAMGKCRALWNKQNQSVHAAEVIKKEFGKKLVTPNQTRWNSVYDSVQCLLGVIDNVDNLLQFNSVIREYPVRLAEFNSRNITFLRQYMAVMEPVAEGLDKLQAEKEAYQGTFLPIICLITAELEEKVQDKEFLQVKPLSEALLQGMKIRFAEAKTNLEYKLAAAFHPKFRVDWMEHFLVSDQPEVVETTVKSMKNLVLEELKKDSESESLSKATTTPTTSKEDNAKTKTKAAWLSKVTAKGAKNAGDEALKKKASSIVDAWLEGTTEKNTFPPSVFGGEKSLMRLFVKYNTGIPSSAGVERMFSIGKLILCDNRNRLSDENFERLMFMKGNM